MGPLILHIHVTLFMSDLNYEATLLVKDFV